MDDLRYPTRKYPFFPLLVSFLIVVTVFGEGPSWFSYLIYLGYFGGLLYVLFQGIHFDIWALLFVLYLPLNIVFTNPDPVFRPWERLIAFVLMFVFCFYPLESINVTVFRNKVLKCLLFFCIIISVISFFCYFLNINLFEDRYYGGYLSDFKEHAGHFSGITKHSMLLGPISGLSIIYLLDSFLKNKRLITILLLVLCFASLIFSASRAAIISTLSGVTLSFIFSKQITKQGAISILLIILVLFFSFIFSPYISDVVSKHDNVELGRFDTRTEKVAARISEFNTDPLIGYGFMAIDPNNDEFDPLTGTIEPGSSWLAILSMTGILGLFLFLILFVKCLKNSKKSSSFIYFALIIFFSVHMIVEGYVFSSGNVLSCLLWLTLGCCYSDTIVESIQEG